MKKYNKFIVIIASLSFFSTPSYAKTLHITTSTPYLASITEMVTGSEAKIDVIMSMPSCPSHYHLKPSDLSKIKNTDLVIYLSDEFEAFMIPLIKHRKGNILSIKKLHNITVTNNNWHIWLDLKNVKIILIGIYNKLIEIAPEQKEKWNKNLELSIKKIQELEIYKARNYANLRKVLLLSDSLEYLFNNTNAYVEKSYINHSMMSMKKINNLNYKTNYCMITSSNENSEILSDKLGISILQLDSEKWGNDSKFDDYITHYKEIIDKVKSECAQARG